MWVKCKCVKMSYAFNTVMPVLNAYDTFIKKNKIKILPMTSSTGKSWLAHRV